MKLKAGYGYWDTTNYSIGGCFKRCGEHGKAIAGIIRKLESPCNGCDIEVGFTDGTKGATRMEHIEMEGTA